MGMACTLRVGAVLFTLIVGGSALQLATDDGICAGSDQTPYEAVSPNFDAFCTVYCVPRGACLDMAQTGKLKYLDISGPGTCIKKGYSTLRTSLDLTSLEGPCKGMTFTKFTKGDGPIGESGTSAMSKAPGDDKKCPKEHKSFEAIDRNSCSVFCVPEGQCEGQVQSGQLNYLGITGEGNCKKKGYTEAGKVTEQVHSTMDFIRNLQGPCKGMTFSKFQKPAVAKSQKPAVAKQKMFVDDRICEQYHSPYEMITPLYPGVCTVFCVPGGECLGQAQTGKLNYLGITGEGNCKGKGYTESAQMGNVTLRTQKYLQSLQGPCKGMTLSKFEKPKTDGKKVFERICGEYQTPFKMTTPLYPGVCTVFCVPGGECLGQAQTGKLNYLGITEEGNCKGKGYTESAQFGNVTLRTQKYLQSLQGPCKGMTLAKFEKPKTDGKKVFERICGEYQTSFKMITPLYPGICTVFCVPNGECQGQAQTGKLNYLGITGEGNCHGDGYTVSSELGNVTLRTQKWLETLQGPCKGMTLSKFQKPGM